MEDDKVLEPAIVDNKVLDEDGICRTLYPAKIRFTYEGFQKCRDKFRYLENYVDGYYHYNREKFDNDLGGEIPFAKWAIRMLAHAFYDYNRQRNTEIMPSLEKSFGIEPFDANKRKKEFAAQAKLYYFSELNMIRMYCKLKLVDASHAAWKLLQHDLVKNPWRFYKFKASHKSLLDAYYREYPQEVFIQWVAETALEYSDYGPFEEMQKDYLAWITEEVPEVGAYIRRKMKSK